MPKKTTREDRNSGWQTKNSTMVVSSEAVKTQGDKVKLTWEEVKLREE